MNQDQFIRSRMLIGEPALDKLSHSRVAVFGLGGVGGHCTDALARSGIGTLHLFDDDKVSLSNLNRQIVALHSTIGQYKVDVMADRALDINPNITVKPTPFFYTPDTAQQLDFSQFDYVIDCIDTVTAKLDLAERCISQNIPIISSMGSANKFDPTAFKVTDISKTEGCPLARIMRKELKKRGIYHLKVVYSNELPQKPTYFEGVAEPPPGDGARPGKIGHKKTPGSLPFVPATAGLILASVVVRDLGHF